MSDEIDVTQEMLAAGITAAGAYGADIGAGCVAAIYRAMDQQRQNPMKEELEELCDRIEVVLDDLAFLAKKA